MTQSAIIVTPTITNFVACTREMLSELREAEHRATQLGRAFDDAQQLAQTKRMLMGRHLLEVRAQLPKRSNDGHGWGAFLGAVELDEATAWRYMKLAEATANLSPEKDRVPTYAEIGLDKREGAEPDPDAPPRTDADAPREVSEATEPEVDRDTWCTPKWIAELIGRWDLDPCSNDRSHINAKRKYDLELRDENGLLLASKAKKSTRVFVNPPYSDVGPWVEAYGHTRFCFLVKFDPSTAWCTELLAKTSLILFPKKDGERSARIAFEPPPGVPNPGGHQFPHGLFFARADDATKAIKAACFQFAHKR
jgi:hypothetical protein